MTTHTTKTLMLMIFAAFAGAITTLAAPVNFSEVSLWVRARETDQSIVREVSQRKLAHAFTPQQETTLKAQGASDSLVQSLRSPKIIANPAEVAASEPKAQPPRMPAPSEVVAPDSAGAGSAGANTHPVKTRANSSIVA